MRYLKLQNCCYFSIQQSLHQRRRRRQVCQNENRWSSSLLLLFVYVQIAKNHNTIWHLVITYNVRTLKMELYFFTRRWVASPPSSKTIFGCQLSAEIHRSIHHQKSSSVSPRHAKTGMFLSAKAAATSFCVL